MAQSVAERKEPSALAVFRDQADKMRTEIVALLPSHITVDRFMRVVLNAVNGEPKLLACERRSLWNACLQAAEDGLVPDKREGAIVPFKSKDGMMATWIPMVAGVRKLVRQSGALRDLNVQIVYQDEADAGAFQHELGGTPFLKHKRMAPPKGDPAKREVHACYSIAIDKDGFLLMPEIMFEAEIMAIARKSKAFAGGPWSDPLFALEMRKKTVTKRHFKQLPTARDLDRVLSRDDSLFDFGRERAEQAKGGEVSTIRGGAAGQLQHFAQSPMDTRPQAERVEVPASEEQEREAEADAAEAQDGHPDEGGRIDNPKPKGKAKPEDDPTETAGAKSVADYAERLKAFLAAAKTVDGIKARWKRDMKTRNDLNMEPEFRNALEVEKDEAIGRLQGDPS